VAQTQRRKEVEYISSKIDQYKRGVDRRLNENMKHLVDELKMKKLDLTPQSNKSTINTIDTSKMKTEVSSRRNQSIKAMIRNTVRY
jgi:hypothetical protein